MYRDIYVCVLCVFIYAYVFDRNDAFLEKNDHLVLFYNKNKIQLSYSFFGGLLLFLLFFLPLHFLNVIPCHGIFNKASKRYILLSFIGNPTIPSHLLVNSNIKPQVLKATKKQQIT